MYHRLRTTRHILNTMCKSLKKSFKIKELSECSKVEFLWPRSDSAQDFRSVLEHQFSIFHLVMAYFVEIGN